MLHPAVYTARLLLSTWWWFQFQSEKWHVVWFWRDRAQVEQGIGGRRNAHVFFNMPCISEQTPNQNIHLDPLLLGQGKEVFILQISTFSMAEQHHEDEGGSSMNNDFIEEMSFSSTTCYDVKKHTVNLQRKHGVQESHMKEGVKEQVGSARICCASGRASHLFKSRPIKDSPYVCPFQPMFCFASKACTVI